MRFWSPVRYDMICYDKHEFSRV